jgi:hypothetical protein
MASTVQMGGGSGVDLSELTSGEKTLIALLAPIWIGYNSSVRFDGLDFSRISSVTVQGKVSLYFIDANNTTLLYKEIMTKETLQVPSGTTKISLISNAVEVSVVSFTTTDGKVHTASNLNY